MRKFNSIITAALMFVTPAMAYAADGKWLIIVCQKEMMHFRRAEDIGGPNTNPCVDYGPIAGTLTDNHEWCESEADKYNNHNKPNALVWETCQSNDWWNR